MITISVCMIVKDEEHCLDRCLKSLESIADEFIIVDTGSSDHTKDIAKKYTDKVYDFKWTGSFSDARNYSFSLATKDYIYCADADEELDGENIKRFLTLKEHLLPEIEMVQMYYCNQLENNTIYNFDKELRPKLYKRLRQFVWSEPIHEQVNLDPVIYDSDIEIIHRPSSVHAGRDLARYEKMIENGESISKRLLNIYEKELYIAGEPANYKTAYEYFEKLCDDDSLNEDELLCALTIALRAAIITCDYKKQFKFALRGVATKGCSELCCEIAGLFYKIGDYEEAAMWYYNAAYETEPLMSIKSKKDIPLSEIVKCYEKLGDHARAEEFRSMI